MTRRNHWSVASWILGTIATEFLFLGIEPYPRKAGAEFAPVKVDDDSARPFAALEALKKRLGSG